MDTTSNTIPVKLLGSNRPGFDKFFALLCKEYKYDSSNEILRRNAEIYYIVETAYKDRYSNTLVDFGRNKSLLSNSSIMHWGRFPRGGKNAGALYAWWDTLRPNDQIISDQAAKQAQNLAKMGFVFAREGMKKNSTISIGGRQYRKIIDFKPVNKVVESWDHLNEETRNILKSAFKYDFLGVSTNIIDRETDHRIPHSALDKKPKYTPPLTLDSLVDGSFDTHYQIVSCSTNILKRSACTDCISGGLIRLPPSIEVLRDNYRQYFDENNLVCDKCFWKDYLDMKDITGLNLNVTAVEEKHMAKVHKVMKNALKYKLSKEPPEKL